MKSYISRGALCAILVILILIAIRFVPECDVAGVHLRRVDIISQLVEVSNEVSEVESLEIDEEEYMVDLESVAREAAEARSAVTPSEQVVSTPREVVALEREEVAVTPIEVGESGAFEGLYRKLLSAGRHTRIAFLGDSFVEGDILTADLRERLQGSFGGVGCGFVPFDSPHQRYRSTVRCESSGWRTYNIMQQEALRDSIDAKWSLSGWVSLPDSGARTEWRTTSVREHIESCTAVRLLFVSREKYALDVAINGGEPTRYSGDGGEHMQQIVIEADSITQLSVDVVAVADGFVGYGAIFEGGDGVVVDNYAIRSNNGQAILWGDPAINAQIDALVGGYDLVVLQYGLNILQRGVSNYSRYAKQVEKMIAYVERCLPSAAVLVMGVSDRSMRSGGEFKPMSEALDMVASQREAAHNMGVGFWDTHAAMAERGGMARFVERGWAAKDYTHINFAGGRELGRALAASLSQAVEAYQESIIKPLETRPMVSERAMEELSRAMSRGGEEVARWRR